MDDTLSVHEAAALLGVSPATIRRRIKAGELRAIRQARPQGYEWRIIHPDTFHAHVPAPADHVPRPPNGLSDDHVSGHVDHLSPSTDHVSHVSDDSLPRVVERLYRENIQLAGQLGFLQAKLQQAEQQLEEAHTQIRLLTTEKEPATTEPPPEAKQPWWKRLFRS